MEDGRRKQTINCSNILEDFQETRDKAKKLRVVTMVIEGTTLWAGLNDGHLSYLTSAHTMPCPHVWYTGTQTP